MSVTDETGGLPPTLQPDHPLHGLGYSKPVRQRSLTRLEGGASLAGEAPVAEEVPVAVVYNGRTHAVMMASPADLEDFAVGFTLTEGILPSADQLHHIEVVRHSQGVELQMSIPEPAAAALKDRGRSLIGRVGCGLCGVESIQEVMRECRPISDSRKISVAALWRAERELPTQQQWNRETGSLHAAAWASDAGGLEVVREDVGRHNALDKVFGALARAGKDPREGFIVITSRASYELVQKVAIMGGRLLAAVSRPTGLAIRLAEASGVTLVALLRGETANVYAHGERLE